MGRLSVYLLTWAVLAGCSIQQLSQGKERRLLPGTWDVAAVESNQKPDADYLDDFDMMLHTLLINAYITLQNDNTFRANLAGQDYQGIWKLEGRDMLSLDEKAQKTVYKLKFTGEKSLLLITDRGNTTYRVSLTRRPGS